jgi:hypothetical protein
MITKQQLLASMLHESKVIKHLAAKVTPEMLDWRPSSGQRSMLELLQYMTTMAIVPATYAVTGTWDHAEGLEREAESVTLDTFAAAMDAQESRLAEVLETVDPAAATTAPAAMPWGQPTTVAAGLMDMPLKCLVAYRMQLFLYLKQCGRTDLGPVNCWAGIDMPSA